MPDAGKYKRMKEMAMELMGMVESYESDIGGMDENKMYGDDDMYNGGSDANTDLAPELKQGMSKSGFAGSGSKSGGSGEGGYSMDSSFRGDSGAGTYGGRGYSAGGSYSMDSGRKKMMADQMKSSMSYRKGRRKKQGGGY